MTTFELLKCRRCQRMKTAANEQGTNAECHQTPNPTSQWEHRTHHTYNTPGHSSRPAHAQGKGGGGD